MLQMMRCRHQRSGLSAEMGRPRMDQFQAQPFRTQFYYEAPRSHARPQKTSPLANARLQPKHEEGAPKRCQQTTLQAAGRKKEIESCRCACSSAPNPLEEFKNF